MARRGLGWVKTGVDTLRWPDWERLSSRVGTRFTIVLRFYGPVKTGLRSRDTGPAQVVDPLSKKVMGHLISLEPRMRGCPDQFHLGLR